MTADEARAAFGDAHDGFLDEDARRDFDAALEADESLRAEFARYQELCRATGSLDEDGPGPDLLKGVQQKIRQRSGGKYFRDRFSERASAGAPLPVVLAGAMLLVLLVAWVLLERTVLLSHDDEPPPARSTPASH